MTKAQINVILKELDEQPDQMIDLGQHSNLHCILFSQSNNQPYYTAVAPMRVYFDSENELIHIYPIKKSDGKVLFMTDGSGKKLCDTYSYESLVLFGFNKNYISTKVI